MNYLLIAMTALVAFTWGMLFAFWLIFARTASRIAKLLEKTTGKEINMEEFFQMIENIIDRAYEEMKRNENR
ncbi:MAG: hypothetical protein J7K61_02350 [Thermoplasmata archaeon]|nr:hypothetical protein [Thermoplasmata archaeon]